MDKITVMKEGNYNVTIQDCGYFVQVSVNSKESGEYSWALVSLGETRYGHYSAGKGALACLDVALKTLFKYMGLEVII